MSEARRDVVFVHIPKTAGTSVRIALQNALKGHLILRDYGQAPETTPELYELIHQEKQPEGFREKFGAPAKGIFLSGHFPAWRYWASFNAESFITFLRHPVDRIFSNYGHRINHHGAVESFEDYLRLPGTCDRLNKLLARVDLANFGFIGFMEEFEASMEALSKYIGTKLPLKKLNTGSYQSLKVDLLGEKREQYRQMVLEMSRRDVDLYEELRAKRGQRFIAPGADSSVSDDYLGLVRIADSVATGWLVNTAREFIGRVQIFRDGQPVAIIAADRPRDHLQKQGLSRTGLCGFRFDLKPHLVPGKPATFAFRALNSTYELSDSPVQIGN